MPVWEEFDYDELQEELSIQVYQLGKVFSSFYCDFFYKLKHLELPVYLQSFVLCVYKQVCILHSNMACFYQ